MPGYQRSLRSGQVFLLSPAAWLANNPEERLPLLLRSTLIYGPAILLTRLSALLLLIVVTRLIDQSEYGLLTLVVTVGEMTDIAVTNWLRVALLRLGGKGDIARGSLMLAGRVLFACTILALAIAAVASFIVVPARWQEFALAVCCYLVAGAVGRFALTVLQMQQRHTTYSLFECLRAALQLLLPIGAVYLFHGSFLVVSLGSSAGMLIAGLAAGIAASRNVVAGPPRFTRQEFFALGLPLIVTAVLGFGLNSVERLFLNGFHHASAVAVFAAAYVLARQPIDMVANAINMGAFPEVVSRFDEEGPEASGKLLSQLMALMVRLCLPIAVLLSVLSSHITELLLPADYHGRFTLLFPIIALSVLCTNLASFVYGSVIYAHKRPWLLMQAALYGSIANILISLTMIPQFAEVGAAMAVAGGSIVALIATIIISERLTHVPVPWRNIGVSTIISLATGLAAWGASYMLGGMPAIYPLVGGGAAGGLMFLLLVQIFQPRATRDFFTKVRLMIRRRSDPAHS